MGHVLIPIKCFILILPFWVFVMYAAPLYDEIRTNPPSDAPNTQSIDLAQGLTGITSGFGLAWNFLTLGPSCVWDTPNSLFIAGILEFIIGGLLLIGVGLQSLYLPRTTSACGSAETWQVEDNSTSLFQYYANIDNSTNPGETADVPCLVFMTSWVMAAVLGTISVVSALYCFKLSIQKKLENEPLLPYRLSRLFLGWIPTMVTSAFLFYVRYLKKMQWRSKVEPLGFKKRTNPYTFSPPGQEPPEGSGCETQLIDLLSNYPVFTSIASELHFSDLNNLSLASKSFREAIFPSDHLAAAVKLARKNCCNGSRLGCWCCGIQICQDGSCKFDSFFPITGTERHLQSCVPYCASCFRIDVCSIPPGKPRKCVCDLSSNTGSYVQRGLCRSCSVGLRGVPESTTNSNLVLRKKKLTAKKVSREKAILWERGSVAEFKCFRCEEMITSRGPRWWVCKLCRRECRSDTHPSWTMTTATTTTERRMMSKRRPKDASDMV